MARITLLGTDGFTHEYIADLVGANTRIRIHMETVSLRSSSSRKRNRVKAFSEDCSACCNALWSGAEGREAASRRCVLQAAPLTCLLPLLPAPTRFRSISARD